MAERLNKRHSDSTRSKIQVSQLINRLQKHVDGDCEMTSNQRQAAEFLVKMALPPPRDEPVFLKDWDPDAPTTVQSRSVMAAIAGGVLTPEQGIKLLSGLASQVQIEKFDELEKRLTEMEAEAKGRSGVYRHGH